MKRSFSTPQTYGEPGRAARKGNPCKRFSKHSVESIDTRERGYSDTLRIYIVAGRYVRRLALCLAWNKMKRVSCFRNVASRADSDKDSMELTSDCLPSPPMLLDSSFSRELSSPETKSHGRPFGPGGRLLGKLASDRDTGRENEANMNRGDYPLVSSRGRCSERKADLDEGVRSAGDASPTRRHKNPNSV